MKSVPPAVCPLCRSKITAGAMTFDEVHLPDGERLLAGYCEEFATGMLYSTASGRWWLYGPVTATEWPGIASVAAGVALGYTTPTAKPEHACDA